MERMRRMAKEGIVWDFAIHDVLANDDHVVVLIEATLTKGVAATHERQVQVMHVRDGKMTILGHERGSGRERRRFDGLKATFGLYVREVVARTGVTFGIDDKMISLQGAPGAGLGGGHPPTHVGRRFCVTFA